MDENLQIIIVTIVIVISSIYAVFRIRKALKNKNGTCYGCPLKDACKKDNRTANNKCIR